MFGAVLVQIRYQNMETIEIIDKLFPTFGNFREGILLYRSSRHNRLAPPIPYKEEVVGSSPIAPTQIPPDIGIFSFSGLDKCLMLMRVKKVEKMSSG
jgi:hypothetical protein